MYVLSVSPCCTETFARVLTTEHKLASSFKSHLKKNTHNFHLLTLTPVFLFAGRFVFCPASTHGGEFDSRKTNKQTITMEYSPQTLYFPFLSFVTVFKMAIEMLMPLILWSFLVERASCRPTASKLWLITRKRSSVICL